MRSSRTNSVSPLRIPRQQLSGAILIAGVIPYVVQTVVFSGIESLTLNTQSFCLVALSTCLGYWLIRSIVTYPGVERTNYIITSLSISYGIILSVLILGRFEYSRLLLITGYILSIAWFYYVSIFSARRSYFNVGLAPSCQGVNLPEVVGITWTWLREPTEVPVGLSAVAADLRKDMPDSWERALADFALRGIPVYHIKHLQESLTGQVDLEHISENNFGSLSPVTAYMSIKHVIDRTLSVFALLAFAPLLLVCCILIKLDTPGPALFRQRRVGYQGKAFTVYKLRTMRCDTQASSEEREAAITKSEDARVTRIGRFLRQSRLDELPQLVNVALGQMSLIGPRPEAEVLSKWYENEIPFYRYRHIVRPGITGWAQVNQGHVAEIDDVKKKLNFDFYYVKNYSPSLDVLIVARTIRTMMTGYAAK